MRWIVDTSAWARRHRPEVRGQLEALIEQGDEFVLSVAVELELLREPQGDAVAVERTALEGAMTVLSVDSETFSRAADAMEELAAHGATAHRIPVPDLITAALADQRECGIVHLDGDFETLRDQSGLSFPTIRIEVDSQDDGDSHPATNQRRLKKDLAQLVHQLPIEEAERFLNDVIASARALVDSQDDNV